MDTPLGLSRDPFVASADGEMFWENAARADLRREASDLLDRGTSVWLQGPPGCGRRTLLGRIASDLSGRGVPVVATAADAGRSAEGFLTSLAEVVGEAPPTQAGLLSLAEHLYGRLVEVFCVARPAVLVLPWELAGEAAAEAGILAELRLVGRPLVSVAGIGSGQPPVEEFKTLTLPPLETDDLRDFLLHRCAAAGRVDLLTPSVLTRALVGVEDLVTALDRARAELRRLSFAASLGQPRELETGGPAAVLDPAQVQEVGRLLDSLSTGSDIS